MRGNMKIAIFDSDSYVREYFSRENSKFGQDLTFFDSRINEHTAILAKDFPSICCFVNDRLNSPTLQILKSVGVELIALRSAGYNNVDLEEAERLDLRVVRVPAYSPHAVAEHAVGLLLCLNRNIHKAFFRVRNLNFATDGLLGFDLFRKTIGVVGTGRIGATFAEIMNGFGCEVIASDPNQNETLVKKGILTYVELPELFKRSDVISLHAPLVPATQHLVNRESLALMKRGIYIINTSRGALIDAKALIQGLKSGHIGGAALDVYEEEEGIFYENLSDHVLHDDVLARLLTFPNMLITSHQGFLTREALTHITEITLQSISDFEQGRPLSNEIRPQQIGTRGSDRRAA